MDIFRKTSEILIHGGSSWREYAPLPVAMMGLRVVSIDNQIFSTGVLNVDRVSTNSVSGLFFANLSASTHPKNVLKNSGYLLHDVHKRGVNVNLHNIFFRHCVGVGSLEKCI